MTCLQRENGNESHYFSLSHFYCLRSLQIHTLAIISKFLEFQKLKYHLCMTTFLNALSLSITRRLARVLDQSDGSMIDYMHLLIYQTINFGLFQTERNSR